MAKRRKKFTPSSQFTVIMTMTYYKTKKQKRTNRVFGPFVSRAAAQSFIRNIKDDIRTNMEEEYLRDVTVDEPLRWDSVEYAFTTAELWVPDLLNRD